MARRGKAPKERANSVFTTKDTKGTKFEILVIQKLRILRACLEITCAGAIWATNWRGASVIPAKAGIHLLPTLDAGLRRHDESRKEPWGGGSATIS